MRTDHGPPSSNRREATLGAALALALTAYGIVAKRRVDRQPTAPKSLTGPGDLTKLDWRTFLRRLVHSITQKHLSFVAAGAAFNAFLAIPAGLAVLVSLSLLIFGRNAVQARVGAVQELIPAYVMQLLSQEHMPQTLGVGLLISLAIDLWTILSGSSCMLTALTVIYGETNTRSPLSRYVTILILAAVTVPFILTALALIAVLPEALDSLPLNSVTRTMFSAIRWPILVVLFMIVLAAIYRYAPRRTGQGWQWASGGAIVAAIIWIAGSVGFSFYVREFVPYDRSYGALGAVMLLLIWLNITAFAILLGAQINVEIEQQYQKEASRTGMHRSRRLSMSVRPKALDRGGVYR